MSNVVNLAVATEDAKRWTLEQLLLHALEKVRSGEIDCNKAVLVVLDDANGEYNQKWMQCGMKSSELVTAFRVAEVSALRSMGVL